MMELHFSGWFQVRMATDPDPTDEKRGVSGYTFAVGDEPDFDRVIRFHDPVAPRSFGPQVGVFVRYVIVNGVPRPDHPFVGAKVHLKDGPQFWMNNYVLVNSAGTQAIEPFHLEISRDDVLVLSKRDFLDPAHPDRSIYDIPTQLAQTRGGALSLELPYFREVTGFGQPVDYRASRKAQLEKALDGSQGVERAALLARLHQFGLYPDTDRRTMSLTFCETRSFDMTGPGSLVDPRCIVPGIDLQAPWPIRFWMGVWDADAMCGYVKGHLEVPDVPGR